MRRTFVLLILIILVSSNVHAHRRGFFLDSPRTMGMGGAGVAVVDEENAFFLNPALLDKLEKTSISFLDIRVRLNQHLFSQYGFYMDHKDQFESLDDMAGEERSDFYFELLEQTRERSSAGFSGVVPLSLTMRGLSFGIFERADAEFDLVEGAAAVPVIQLKAQAEAEAILGFARNLSRYTGRDLSIGLNAKYVYRGIFDEARTAPALETFDNPNVYHGWTVSFDLGVLYTRKHLSIGFAIYDFISPGIAWSAEGDLNPGLLEPEGKLNASSRIGVAYRPSWCIPGFLEDFQLAGDLACPLSGEIGFFNKLCFGGEVLFSRFFRLRSGFHQGYPTAGVGISASIFKLQYVFYGKSLGVFPGQIDNWNHLVSIGWGWDL